MFELIFALFMAFSCPAHNHNSNKSNTAVVTMDTGGDGEHVPPGINPPPPPGS